jgi:hypothetical protein
MTPDDGPLPQGKSVVPGEIIADQAAPIPTAA